MTWTLFFQLWGLIWITMAGYDIFVKPVQWERPRRVKSNGD